MKAQCREPRACLVVSPAKRRSPICYNPHAWDPQNDTIDFGKPPVCSQDAVSDDGEDAEEEDATSSQTVDDRVLICVRWCTRKNGGLKAGPAGCRSREFAMGVSADQHTSDFLGNGQPKVLWFPSGPLHYKLADMHRRQPKSSRKKGENLNADIDGSAEINCRAVASNEKPHMSARSRRSWRTPSPLRYL